MMLSLGYHEVAKQKPWVLLNLMHSDILGIKLYSISSGEGEGLNP